MLRRYASCAVFTVAVLLIGVLLSLPISIEVNRVGEKPPFLFVLLVLIMSLFIFISGASLSYTAWIDGAKMQEKAGVAMDTLAKGFGPFRFVVIRNRLFLLWFIRIFYPIFAVLGLVLFLLFLLTAF